MEVKLSQAVKMFFANSSLEMVYIEAIANALDANATEIKVQINIDSYSDPDSLKIEISDNGIGFTDDRYRKFCKLFDVDETSHKGLGRLVYPFYFEKIKISSNYDGVYLREFDFTESLDEDNSRVREVSETDSGTKIKLEGYNLTKVKKHDYVKVDYLRDRILEEFYPRLYNLKTSNQAFSISISSTIEGRTYEKVLTINDIPDLETVELNSSIDLISKFRLHYKIKKTPNIETSLITAISVDSRTKKVDIIADENLPVGYTMVFLLFSDWFEGKVDFSRQSLTIPDHEMKSIQAIFREKVKELIDEEIPEIVERNKHKREVVIDKFPHLSGYFNENDIGYVSYDKIIRNAQDKFFKAQREILDAQELSDEQYDKSMELSSRALTEYILFRQYTINKLKEINNSNSETEIHNIIVPKYKQFDKRNISEDLYLNNAWILDDKYMTYEAVLSDKKMNELVDYITDGEYKESDEGQPDIAIIFSNDPETSEKFDIVIVELKKKGIKLEKAMAVETQLVSRARKLMKHYNSRIQRIWFYGVVEFNEDLELHLRGSYTELFSMGKVYYKPTFAAIQLDPEIKVPIEIHIMDLDSVVKDADARNSTFLNLIKNKFKTS
ncbi:MAG: ATP-binding protein [Balneola sp.]|jgi:hypothetical protein